MLATLRNRTTVLWSASGLGRCDLAAACFAACWLLIACVSVHDAYLVAICSDVIVEEERNPIGKYLLAQNNGAIGLFLLVKGMGTAVVCTCLLLLYQYCRRLALAVSGPVASFQFSLLLYLSLR